MTDNEIRQYLTSHYWKVNAQDCLMEVFNTSPQIISQEYDPKTGIMEIITPDNKFRFTWMLKHYGC